MYGQYKGKFWLHSHKTHMMPFLELAKFDQLLVKGLRRDEAARAHRDVEERSKEHGSIILMQRCRHGACLTRVRPSSCYCRSHAFGCVISKNHEL